MESEVTQTAGYYRVLAWLEVNKKQVVYGVAAATVVGLIAWYFIWSREQARIEAGESFARVFVSQTIGAAGRAETASAYLKVASEHANSEAGARALLMAGASLFAENKYAEAQTQFEKFVREYRNNPLIGQAQFGVAAALDAQGKTNEAVTAYKAIIDRRSAESVLPQAKFALARLYLAQGSPEAAYQLYEGLATDERFSSIGSEAGMRAEELKLKYPQLAPKPEAPAVSLSAPIIISNTVSAATNR